MISLNNINFSYEKKTILKNISFNIFQGTFLGIVGPNGTGKTTLLKIISGILQPNQGDIKFNGKELSKFNRNEASKFISFMPQSIIMNFPFTVLEFVLMGRLPYSGGLSFNSFEDKESAEEAMKFTETDKLKDRLFMQLSGGEQKRVMLARALCQNTSVLLLDEPTQGMDLKYQTALMDRLYNKIQHEKKTVIMVTHDINLASLYCSNILLLHNGSILANGSPSEVFLYSNFRTVFETDIYIGHNELNGKLFVLPISKIKN